MIKVIKRNDKIQYFDQNKIVNAIVQAMRETIKGVDKELAANIAQKIEEDLKDYKESVTVSDIQEQVETELMNSERKDVAKTYILYREQRDKLREIPTGTSLTNWRVTLESSSSRNREHRRSFCDGSSSGLISYQASSAL